MTMIALQINGKVVGSIESQSAQELGKCKSVQVCLVPTKLLNLITPRKGNKVVKYRIEEYATDNP